MRNWCAMRTHLENLGKTGRGKNCQTGEMASVDMSDLNIRALGLLNFAEQSVADGLKDPSTMLECFSEADGALRILGKTLLREDQQRYARLALIDIFRISFVGLAENNAGDLASAFNDPRERIEFAKTFFSDQWQPQ